jgi:hypothetical protein
MEPLNLHVELKVNLCAILGLDFWSSSYVDIYHALALQDMEIKVLKAQVEAMKSEIKLYGNNFFATNILEAGCLAAEKAKRSEK